TLEKLKGDYRLVVITKGDLFDQERKLAASGIDHFFDAVEIVSEKERTTYERIFAEQGEGPGRAMMVGNSLRSDIIPALEAGSWATFIPHEHAWALEHAEEPVGQARYQCIEEIAQLPAKLS
ncbi:MAG: HAD hydrolase-like protein, partial [Hyphomicrobiaceae bacterium]|nr:HAD hydrolase-like protein [Hyphomicrobiaceae bacterium]